MAAVEILKATSRTKEYIERGESEGKSLVDAMEQGEQEGMQTFDGVIENLIRRRIVKKEDAIPFASNQGNLLLRLADWDGSAAPPAAEAKPAQNDSMIDMIER